MSLSQKVKDYITIWNTGVSFIYFAVGVVNILQYIMMMQTMSKYSDFYGVSSSTSSIDFEKIMVVVFAIVMFVAGITNLFYARKYLRDDNPKSTLGWIATISLMVSNLYLLFMIIKVMTNDFNMSSSGVTLKSMFTSEYAWELWLEIFIVVFNAVAAVIGFMNMLKWSPMTIDGEVSGIQTEPGGIAADVATHAMGHEAPSTEMAATETAKKDLPPMLSAEPEEPVVNHGVVTGSPAAPTEETPATPSVELNQAALDPLATPAAPEQAVAPVEPAATPEVVPEQPADPMANFGKL